VAEIRTPLPQPDAGDPEHTGAAGTVSLWAGIVGAPLAWLFKLQAMYVIVPWACPVPHRMIYIHLLSLVVLALSAGAGFLSWREWVRAGRLWPSGRGASPVMRTRFLAALGMMNSAMFFLLSLGQGIAALMLNPCWT
jgi:hypothetical protein